MPLALAKRSSLIAPSATLMMGAEAKRLKAQGIEVLDFALGEPDFDTPANIQQAAWKAISGGPDALHAARGHSRAAPGDRRALHAPSRLPTECGQVVVSNGAKHSLHNALMAVCGPGDEVVIPAPYWVSYSDLVKLTGATPVVIPTTESVGIQAHAEQFLEAITPRTKLLMINSPSNPTGVVYDRAELEALAEP